MSVNKAQAEMRLILMMSLVMRMVGWWEDGMVGWWEGGMVGRWDGGKGETNKHIICGNKSNSENTRSKLK